MESQPSAQSGQNNQTLSTSFIFLLAVTCGVIVANMYYVQPIGTVLAETFNVKIGTIGFVTMITQLGYALGLLFLVPLGDTVNRRTLILRLIPLSMLALVGAAVAPNFIIFAVVSLCIGLFSVVPQIIIPFGAVLAGPKERGKVMGKLLSGLLTGILLSRTASGISANYLGWRAIYWLAVGLSALLWILLYVRLPAGDDRPSSLTYRKTLASLPHLMRSQPILQASAVSGFFMFGTFSLFWSTLIFYISSPVYGWGTWEAGLLAILGLSGACAAPIVGRLADSFAPKKIVLMGNGLQIISFVLLALAGSHLSALVVAIILLDIGVQFGQVANQTRVQALGVETSSRNNTLFMVCYFLGGAAGSLLGSLLWEQVGWQGVTICGLIFQLVAVCYALIKDNR